MRNLHVSQGNAIKSKHLPEKPPFLEYFVVLGAVFSVLVGCTGSLTLPLATVADDPPIPTPMPAPGPTLVPKGIQYFVSPSGNDAWSGQYSSPNKSDTDGPFKTIEHAQEIVRSQIAGNMTRDVEVLIGGGNYYLDKPLSFNEHDSGQNGFEVIYRNIEGETPVLYGGERILTWQTYRDGIYVADLASGSVFHTLYENEDRAVQARSPNEGYFRATSINGEARRQFGFKSEGFPVLEPKAGIMAYIWPAGIDGDINWVAQFARVQDINYDAGVVTLETPVAREINTGGSRYFLQGALSLLDRPGEFYFDPTASKLYYWPLQEPIAQQHIVVPRMHRVIEVAGSSLSSVVHNMRFQGLTLTSSDFSQTPGSALGGAIYINSAQTIEIVACHIFNIGDNGVMIQGKAERITIHNNLINNIGYHGIFVQSSVPGNGYVSKQNVILGNYIHDIGQNLGHGAGMYLFGSGENYIAQNLIRNGPRYGIAVAGLTSAQILDRVADDSGFDVSNIDALFYARDNIVEFNDLSNLNLDSQDTGLIMTWGLGPGNIIQSNRLHHSNIPFSFGYGVYADGGSNQLMIRNNLLYALQDGGDGELSSPIMVKGSGGQVINNIMANNGAAQGGIRSIEHDIYLTDNLTITHNIFYENGTNSIYSFPNWSEDRVAFADYNLMYNASSEYRVWFENPFPLPSLPRTFNDWLTIDEGKYDQNSVEADPHFVDPSQGDYRVQYTSPALALGIENVNLPAIGLPADFPFAEMHDPLEQLYLLSTDSKYEAWSQMVAGETTQLYLTGRTLTGYVADLSDASLAFASNNETVASVNVSGLVRAHTTGVARVAVLVIKNDIVRNAYIDVVVEQR
jgi:Right handed beta helix region